MKFVNPLNGYEERVGFLDALLCFLFGSFYFMFKGMHRHVAVYFVLFMSCLFFMLYLMEFEGHMSYMQISAWPPLWIPVPGLSLIWRPEPFYLYLFITKALYPVWAILILKKEYLRKGWQLVG